MKSIKLLLVIAVAIIFVIAATPAKKNYTLLKDYEVTIHGTSNLHDWDEKVTIVSGSGTITWNTDGSFDLDALNIRMNANSIKSDMGSVMNKNTYKALKTDEHPEIIFMLKIPVKSINAKDNQRSIPTKGSLTIAGVTKLVDMKVRILMDEHEKLSFQGSQTIKMTDYGVDPPKALFGTLKTGNEITINFKTIFISNK